MEMHRKIWLKTERKHSICCSAHTPLQHWKKELISGHTQTQLVVEIFRGEKDSKLLYVRHWPCGWIRNQGEQMPKQTPMPSNPKTPFSRLSYSLDFGNPFDFLLQFFSDVMRLSQRHFFGKNNIDLNRTSHRQMSFDSSVWDEPRRENACRNERRGRCRSWKSAVNGERRSKWFVEETQGSQCIRLNVWFVLKRSSFRSSAEGDRNTHDSLDESR